MESRLSAARLNINPCARGALRAGGQVYKQRLPLSSSRWPGSRRAGRVLPRVLMKNPALGEGCLPAMRSAAMGRHRKSWGR
jgi:hypothetical protein